jgi:probable H4MPT-linked C1 transfer pathway protein
MGSTTTDLVPIVSGAVAAQGYSDAERLITGELVYTGATRTFLMATAERVPFRGQWTPIIGEYFANIADVHRILGTLPEGVDMHPTADGREKTAAASMARLARMIGRDAAEGDEADWRNLAEFYAVRQLSQVEEAARRVIAASGLADDAPLVIAGAGRFVLKKLAVRLGRRCEAWEGLVPADPAIAGAVSDCAPAAAVALLSGDR